MQGSPKHMRLLRWCKPSQRSPTTARVFNLDYGVTMGGGFSLVTWSPPLHLVCVASLVVFARRRNEALSKSSRKLIGAAMANLLDSPH